MTEIQSALTQEGGLNTLFSKIGKQAEHRSADMGMVMGILHRLNLESPQGLSGDALEHAVKMLTHNADYLDKNVLKQVLEQDAGMGKKAITNVISQWIEALKTKTSYSEWNQKYGDNLVIFKLNDAIDDTPLVSLSSDKLYKLMGLDFQGHRKMVYEATSDALAQSSIPAKLVAPKRITDSYKFEEN